MMLWFCDVNRTASQNNSRRQNLVGYFGNLIIRGKRYFFYKGRVIEALPVYRPPLPVPPPQA